MSTSKSTTAENQPALVNVHVCHSGEEFTWAESAILWGVPTEVGKLAPGQLYSNAAFGRLSADRAKGLRPYILRDGKAWAERVVVHPRFRVLAAVPPLGEPAPPAPGVEKLIRASSSDGRPVEVFRAATVEELVELVRRFEPVIVVLLGKAPESDGGVN